jgi:hypothetical protein
MYLNIKVMLYLRGLVSGLPLRHTRFDHRSGYVGFAVENVTLAYFLPSA